MNKILEKEMKQKFIVILVTAKDTAEAQKISQALLEKKLVACANIVPAVKSFFWWEGKSDNADEVLVIMKTQKKLFSKVITLVKALHSYSVPEIIALPIVAGSKDYLAWVAESTIA